MPVDRGLGEDRGDARGVEVARQWSGEEQGQEEQAGRGEVDSRATYRSSDKQSETNGRWSDWHYNRYEWKYWR